MHNKLTRLIRAENLVPTNQNPRILVQEQSRNPIQEQIIRIVDKNEEHRPRVPRVPNPNVVVLEEIFENFYQEVDIIQDEILEYVQKDEGESSFYIFKEQGEPDISQENVV
jgi:hypothetical protein